MSKNQLLEKRHETKLAWNEPWEARGPEGNELSVHVTIQATVHDCINLQRMTAKAEGRPTMGGDGEFLIDFMTTHGAWVVEKTIPRAEAEREIKMWKSNHDNQVRIKRAIASRPDLAERAPLVEKLMAEVAELQAKLEDNGPDRRISHPEWTQEEIAAIKALAEAKDMPPETILRQALRAYQLAANPPPNP